MLNCIPVLCIPCGVWQQRADAGEAPAEEPAPPPPPPEPWEVEDGPTGGELHIIGSRAPRSGCAREWRARRGGGRAGATRTASPPRLQEGQPSTGGAGRDARTVMWRSAMGQRRGRVALAAAAMAAAVTAAAMAAPAAATAVGNDRCRGRRRTARQHRRRRRARRRTASGRRRWRGRRCCRRRRLGGDGAARARAAAEREGQKEEQGRLKGARPIAAPARLSTPPAPSHLELCEMPRRPHTRHPMPASAAHLRGVAIDPARWGHGWTNGGAGPYTRRPPPPAPNTPRDYGKPRSSLERPDPENSRSHTCTEIEYGMPLPQEL